MSKKLAIAMFGQKRLSREGGVEIVVKELCTRMAQNGCDVTCYNRAGHHVSGAEYDDAGKTEYEGIRQKSVPTIERRGLAAVSSSAFAALYSAFGKYDVVHIHAEGPAFFAWLPKMFGKRVVVTVHGIDWQREKWQSGLGSKFIHQGEKNAAKYADEVIVLSKGVQDYFKETYGRETHFIPNGVNRPQIREASLITDKFGLKKDSYILFLGRLVPEKGIRYLVEAFKNVKTDKKLVIAGGSSDTDSFIQQNSTRYRTALYLRLSREDGDKTESDSIANQRTLLEAYTADHPELCIVDEFVDDGYSGSNFERPAFQNLFRELEQGTINCILVKDLSRFGRNYIEVGRYLERIFPVMRVRLIAVTDNYDSQSAWKTSDSIMVPMRNLLNDAYCRDISVKIKSQLAVKRKRGDFVGSFATYGYQKDPGNHTKLIVDELAAETVQDIFRWKINGMSNQGIADRLNVEKVPSPAARKLQSGAKLSLHFRKSDEPPWSAKAVDRILHNEVYIGKLVQGKTRRLDYRSKKKMNVPMRDWVIVDNTHEAIIPAEQFELVRRILETETRRPNDAETVALFAGFLYCGDCGSRLVRRSASYKEKRYIYYQCSSSKQNKDSCTSHNLRDEKLYNIVRNALQMQIQIVMEEAEFVESIRQARQEPYRVRRIERQIRQLTAEKAHTQGIKEKLYGDYVKKIEVDHKKNTYTEFVF